MVKVTNKNFYMDGYLKSNLDVIKKVTKKDWDFVFVIDGTEGSGKSTLAQQIAYFLDPTFNIDRITFRPDEFKKTVIKTKPHKAIIFDEAYSGLSSRQAMTLVNKTLVDMFAEIRQKNLFLIIVLPTFFDLDRHVALWRSRILIHVYARDGFNRGYFSFYNMEKKKKLYLLGKKLYNYKCVSPNFIGRFPKPYMVDENKYKEKKLESLRLMDKSKPLREDKKWLINRNTMIYEYWKLTKAPHQKIADIMNKKAPKSISRRTIFGIVANKGGTGSTS